MTYLLIYRRNPANPLCGERELKHVTLGEEWTKALTTTKNLLRADPAVVMVRVVPLVNSVFPLENVHKFEDHLNPGHGAWLYWKKRESPYLGWRAQAYNGKGGWTNA